MSFSRRLILAVALLSACLPSFAQKDSQTDSLVRLMNAKFVQLLEINSQSYRKAVDARFLHNDTYLICDTALWNVDTRIINAFGHVQVLQEQTVLSSDKLDYIIDENVAQFRGSLVQLLDKDGNTLRTRNLDYNTKDSLAMFFRGGSMRDKDGQIIESLEGTYDSKIKEFTFSENVNMYTDSVFVSTDKLVYHSETSTAVFTGGLNAWKDNGMLSSDNGWYDRVNELFLFKDDVHGMSRTQEVWCDSLFYHRLSEDVDMRGHVQATDTTKSVSAMADYMYYSDSLSQITLRENAAIAARTESQNKTDTIYIGADRMVYRDIIKGDLPDHVMTDSQKRVSELSVDPVTEYRRKAAQAAAANSGAQNNNAAQNQPAQDNAAPPAAQENEPPSPQELTPPADSLSAPVDSLAAQIPPTSDEPAVDSAEDSAVNSPDDTDIPSEEPEAEEKPAVEVPQPKDSTKVGFLTAVGRVRIFRTDMQAVCDSLEYTDLDSLARMYIDPVVWNEENRQYRSDSLTVITKDKRMERASLMSNAFITIQEDTVCYDQIKGAEVMAYFDEETALRRFDALGGASAVFYLEENEAFATVNKVESKMLSAYFNEGEIQTISYFDSPKNDAYPVVQLPKEEQRLKGFSWVPERRPRDKSDITDLTLRPGERSRYARRMRPAFRQTNIYFPGHISKIYRELERQDSIRRAHRLAAEEASHIDEETLSEMDSLAMAIHPELTSPEQTADSLALATGDAAGKAAAADSLGHAAGLKATADSLGQAPDILAVKTEAVKDSLATAPKELSKAEQRAIQREAAEKKRQERIDAREARWAELDARDARKAAEKEAKAQERYRKKTYKAVLRANKRAAKEQKQLDRYIEKYRRQKSARGK